MTQYGTTPRRILAALACVGIGLGLVVSPAAATESGRFGQADPTYDGVYRQGLTILALQSFREQVPRSAIRWLKRQQCKDGGFPAYRSNVTERCKAPRSAVPTAPDTNSTAMAAMALVRAGKQKPAKRALRWLVGQQRRSGGFPYYAGMKPDANSTGLALAALATSSGKYKKERRTGRQFLGKLSLQCRGDRFLLRYRKDTAGANMLASAQGAIGYVGSLPPRTQRYRARTASSCSGTELRRVGDHGWDLLRALRKQLRDGDGLLLGPGGEGDITATAQAATALAMASTGKRQVRSALSAIRPKAAAYIGSGVNTRPAAAAQLLILRAAADRSPSYAGVDLRTAILDTLQ